jgi:hypothetical protein
MLIDKYRWGKGFRYAPTDIPSGGEPEALEALETVETTNEAPEETPPVETTPAVAPASPTDEELDRQAYERLAARHPNVIRREEEEAKPEATGFDWQNPDESMAKFQQQTTTTTVQLAMKAIEARDQLGIMLANEGADVKAAASRMLSKLTPQQLTDPTAVEGIAAYVVGQAVLSGKRTTVKAPASSTPAATQNKSMSAEMQRQLAIANKVFGDLTPDEVKEVMAG